MSKVNFKSYLNPQSTLEKLPSDLEVIAATYGPFLTIEQAAQCLNRSYGTVYGFVRNGSLPSSRTGRNGGYIIPATAILKFTRQWPTATG